MRSLKLKPALFTVGLVTAGWVAFGCASHPTVGDALRSMFDAACTRIQQCSPSGFATEFPMGEQSCVNQLVGSSTEDPDEETACTSDEISACVNDIKAMTCDQFANLSGTSSLPASCQKC